MISPKYLTQFVLIRTKVDRNILIGRPKPEAISFRWSKYFNLMFVFCILIFISSAFFCWSFLDEPQLLVGWCWMLRDGIDKTKIFKKLFNGSCPLKRICHLILIFLLKNLCLSTLVVLLKKNCYFNWMRNG